MGKVFQSSLTRLEKLKAGLDQAGLDRNKQHLLLEAKRLKLRVNSFLRSGFGCMLIKLRSRKCKKITLNTCKLYNLQSKFT